MHHVLINRIWSDDQVKDKLNQAFRLEEAVVAGEKNCWMFDTTASIFNDIFCRCDTHVKLFVFHFHNAGWTVGTAE